MPEKVPERFWSKEELAQFGAEPDAELRQMLANIGLLGEMLAHVQMRGEPPAGLRYNSGEHFVILHGEFYDRAPWTGQYKQGAPRYCYGNAIILAAMYNLPYIEGYARAPGLPYMHHAWNLDEAGRLLDTTWCNTAETYRGVRFSVERADDATWNGDSCVLHDHKRRHPLFQEVWKGEDFARVWPASERLAMLRRKQWPEMQSWLESAHEEKQHG